MRLDLAASDLKSLSREELIVLAGCWNAQITTLTMQLVELMGKFEEQAGGSAVTQQLPLLVAAPEGRKQMAQTARTAYILQWALLLTEARRRKRHDSKHPCSIRMGCGRPGVARSSG